MYKSAKQLKKPLKNLSLSISLVLAAGSLMSVPVYANPNNIPSYYQVEAGSLSDALNQVAQQSKVSILFNTQQLNRYQATALTGNYTTEQAFEKLLENKPFQIQKTAAGYLLLDKTVNTSVSTPVTAAAVADNQQTAQSINTTVATTSETAVVQLTPMVVYGVASRDTQGYNAVYDQDISSVYAGKEQIERYKGAQPADLFKGMVGVYSGDARNSGALDPSIRGIQGPGRVPVLIDGTEQALTVWRGYNGANNRSYVDPNLIGGIQVLKGPSLTRNVNTGVGGAVVVSTLNVNDVLKDGKNFGGEFKVETSNNAVKPRQPNLLTGQSIYDNPNYPPVYQWGNNITFEPFYDPTLFKKARTDREQNIYSGDDIAARIALAGRTDHFEVLAAYAYRDKGNHFSGKNGSDFYNQPSTERYNYVPYLAKVYPAGTEVPNTSLKTESYLLKTAWKPTDEHRLEFGYRDTSIINGEILPSRIAWDKLVENKTGVPQWPLSEIDSKSYNLEYKYQPKDNQWIDFYSNIWQTDTESSTYSAGGFPNDTNKNLGIFINSALANSDNTRKGITLSNKFNLLSNLDLTVGGSYQKEKLSSDDIYRDPYITGSNLGLRMTPRAGEREEKEFNLNFEFKPISWLTLNAGARYQNYWAFDDFLNERVKAGDAQFTTNTHKITAREMVYYTKADHLTDEMIQQATDEINSIDYYTEDEKKQEILRFIYSQRNTVNYEADSRGKLTRENNPFLNGTLEGVDYARYSNNGQTTSEIIDLSKTGVQKNKDHGWTPTASAAINFTQNSRMYLRYSEAYRMPSMFESTVGFSGTLSGYKLAPEHAHNYEVAYIHNLSDLFASSTYADVKLAYYYNKTENAIERSPTLAFSNVDSHTIEGLELQSRFDNGSFFTDLSAHFNLKNKVCDENSAMLLGMNSNFSVADCVDDGFVGGYLVSMAIPKYSVNWTIGGRFLDQKLELGTRATYNHKYENPETKNYNNIEMSYYANTPLAWDSMVILDAYVNYKLKEDTLFELVGTNITDEFYIDPLTRSSIAAPGRTFKLSITHKF